MTAAATPPRGSVRTRAAGLLATGALLACAVAGCGLGAPPPGTPDATTEEGPFPMQIQIELTKSRFAARESIPAAVVISNTGAAPIDVPAPEDNSNRQPTYTVRGPRPGDERTVDLHSAVFKDDAPAPAGAPSATVALAPGASHRAEIPLHHLFDLVEPGEYRVTADLVWGGTAVHSAPVTFSIVRPSLRACDTVVRPGLQDVTTIPVFCLSGEGADAELQVAMFQLDLQTDRVVPTGVSRFAVPGPGARRVLAPWLNYDGLGTPSARAGWQADATLGLADFRETGGAALTLPWTPRVVRPLLAAETGEVDAFVLDDDGPALGLVRFPAAGTAPTRRIGEAAPASPPPPPSPRLLWRIPLPARPVAARAALPPKGGGDGRFVLLVAGSADATELLLFSAGDGAAAEPPRIVRVEGLVPLADSEPALRVAADGTVQASVLLGGPTQADGSRSVSVIDATWPAAASEPGRTVATQAATLGAAPRAGAVAYSVAPGTSRREWIVVASDGGVLTDRAPATPVRLAGTAVLPLQLLGMETRTYVLTTSAAGTLDFELL